MDNDSFGKSRLEQRFAPIIKFSCVAYACSPFGGTLIAALSLLCLTSAAKCAPELPSAVDLSPYYTSVFRDPAGADSTFKGYGGRKTVDGLPFEIGGKIVL